MEQIPITSALCSMGLFVGFCSLSPVALLAPVGGGTGWYPGFRDPRPPKCLFELPKSAAVILVRSVGPRPTPLPTGGLTPSARGHATSSG